MPLESPDGATKGAGPRSAFARYGFAVLVSLLAFLAVVALLEVEAQPIYGPLLGALVLAIWYGGLLPAVVSLVVSWGLALWLLAEPTRPGTAGMSRWWANAVVGILILVFGAALSLRQGRTARLAETTQESLRELASIQSFSTALAASVSPLEVSRALVEHGSLLLGGRDAVVAVVDGEALVVEHAGGTAATRLPKGRRLPLSDDTPLTRAVAEGHAVSGRHQPAAGGWADTVVAVPIREGGEVTGVVAFRFAASDAVDEEVVGVARTVTGLAEQAYERARLFERELESRLALDRILEVAPRFQADTAEEIGEAVCREARTTFGTDYAVLWRLRDERLELLHMSPSHMALVGKRWPLEDFPGLASAVRTVRVAFVPDVLVEATGVGLEFVRELGIRSSLRTPIAIGGRTELVLALSWQVIVSEPDPSTLAVVRRFADQAGLALEEFERRRAEALAAERADETRRLQEVTANLSLAATGLDVGNVCLRSALDAVGAEAGFVVLARPGDRRVEILTSSGYDEEELDSWAAYALDDDVPFARAIASGEPVWALSDADVASFPALRSRGDAGWVALPLRTRHGVHGAVHVSLREPRELDEARRRWLENAVSQCAQAFERSRLFEEEQALRSRAERAQSMTAALANATTRQGVADVAVDEIAAAVDADGAAVGLVHEERSVVVTLARRGYSQHVAETLAELALDEATHVGRAAVRRVPVFGVAKGEVVEVVPDIDVGGALGGHCCFAFVPLLAGRRASGVLTLSWTGEVLLTDEEERFVESLASQVALALDRATHLESEQTIAETLQRSVLPASLPRVEGVQLAARYLPGTAELDVGGDWFDAVQLPSGKLGIVIGDVVGKGVHAAASMGQLRNALRAFAFDRLKPASVLTRLNRMSEEVLETTFATVVYAVLDPESRVCRFASAGHPPPLVVYPDGRVELLEGGRGLPLGSGYETKYRQDTVELPAGSVLLLYTDGLVERRGRPIDEGIEALVRAAGEAPSEPRRLLEHVVDTLVGDGERADDIAAIAVRALPVAPRPLDLLVPSKVGSLDLVRDAIRIWLEGAPMTSAEAEEVLLAAWEGTANAIEHAVEPDEEKISIRADLEDFTVRLVIEDTGRWAPETERPGRGLGLQLMRSVMSTMDIETSERGTRVVVSKELAGVADAR